MAKRRKNKESAGHILAVLKAGWPQVEQIDQLEQTLLYSRNFLGYFDNFSYTLIGIIAVCVIAAFFSLKHLAKLFSGD
jgi:hypothetical protein